MHLTKDIGDRRRKMPYISDCAFIDYVHDNLAVDIIYPQMD